MKKNNILLSAVLLSITALNVTCSQVPAKKPNVIIILADDMGWRDASFQGSTDIPTPHLDQLARSGVVFTQGYASHPYCSPSRAGLLTGRYQQRFGHECNTPYKDNFDDPTIGLPLSETLIPEVMKANGYKTCVIGKWHLGENPLFWPTNRGFDYWYGFLGGGLSYWGDTGKKPEHMGVMKNGILVPKNQLTYLTDDFSSEAVNYIERNKDNPFFMYLAYNTPHGPNHVTREYLNMTQYIENGNRAVYAAMIKGMDEGIGKVISRLEKLGILNNTLIIFYSDNGGRSDMADNSPFRGHKGNLFEGGIRVPFVISWPEAIPGGKTFTKPIIALDIFPTILSAAGIEEPQNLMLDGLDLLPYIKGENNGLPHENLFWRYSGGKGYAVRDGDYKLVREEVRLDTFLFDIKNDPLEMNNLAKKMPEKMNELQTLYENWAKGTIQPLWLDPHFKNVVNERETRRRILQAASGGKKK